MTNQNNQPRAQRKPEDDRKRQRGFPSESQNDQEYDQPETTREARDRGETEDFPEVEIPDQEPRKNRNPGGPVRPRADDQSRH